MRRILDSAGFATILASDGVEAIELMRSEPEVDIVLLDRTMPRLGGLETFAELRRIRDDLPVILCSGYSDGPEDTSPEDAGFAGFASKPFDRRTLLETIEKALEAFKA